MVKHSANVCFSVQVPLPCKAFGALLVFYLRFGSAVPLHGSHCNKTVMKININNLDQTSVLKQTANSTG